MELGYLQTSRRVLGHPIHDLGVDLGRRDRRMARPPDEDMQSRAAGPDY
jgi:hypothetical protein